tara:strand:+ start:67 stop:387 length:321 start_codon:yes stop_codon:yes gene_type:complete
MTVEFNWTVADLQRNLADGMITTVHWRVDAFDGTYGEGAYGSIGLEPAEADSMIPYADITEEIVVQWVKDHYGAEKIEEVEQALTARIEEQRTPSVGNGLPWSAEA